MTEPAELNKKPLERKTALMLVIVLLLGGFLIFAGADWGLPVNLHPDERTIVEPAIRLVENRSFEPDVFYRPDHLLIQINALIYRFIVLINNIDIADMLVLGSGIYYLTARIVTGLFAMGSILMAFLIGRRYSTIIGLVAAFLFAVFPLFVTHSKYATSDVPITFLMMLFIYFSLNYMQKPVFKNIVIMALITAAFITIKYPGAILLVMIAVSVIVSSIIDKKYLRILKHGIVTIVSVIFFIFLISPVLILKFNDVRSALLFEARAEHLGADGLGMGGNMLFYVSTFLNAGGIILLVFFFFGCYALISERKTLYKHLPLFYGFIYWICLSYVSLHWERWALPMYVSPLIISAIGVKKVCDMIRTSNIDLRRQKIALRVFIVFLCVSAANLVTASFGNQLDFLMTDTRIASQGFVEEKDINQDNTASEGYSTLKPTHGGFIFWAFKMDVDPPRIAYDNIEYLIISSYQFERINNERNRYHGEAAFYELLHENFIEIKRFEPAKRNLTWFDPVNIIFNISYLVRATNNGMSGPTLIYYEVSAENYYTDPH